MPRPPWPADVEPYRRSPIFDQDSVPAALQRGHSTRPGTWARLHVLEGRLGFRDLIDGDETVLEPGVHPLIHPGREHEVFIVGPVRFLVEFCEVAPAPGHPRAGHG